MAPSFRLVVVKGPDESRTADLPAGGKMVLGRGSGAGFQLKDDQVSRSHCAVHHGPSGPAVSDMGSRNGTFLNGRKIQGTEPLKDGDVIQIGNSTLTLEQTGVPTGSAAPAGPYFCLSCGASLDGPCKRCGPQFLTPPDGLPGLIIEERLGGGGMGTVFKGHRLSDDHIVALKVMAFVGEPRKDGLKRFFREARIPKGLDHVNIVQVYGTGAAQAKPPEGTLAPHQKPCKAVFIILEYVEGNSVNGIVGEWGCLDIKDAVRIASCVADALALAAERGIVHRDIKPENIMITGDGTVKLMDFGLSKSFEDAGLSGVTKSGHALGTPVFMAPEQIQDARYADHRADIYSLGATLFYMLTGKHPFTGNRVREILFKVLEEPAPPLEDIRPGIPPAVSKMVAQCLEKDPEKRYPTTLHLKKELDGILELMK